MNISTNHIFLLEKRVQIPWRNSCTELIRGCPSLHSLHLQEGLSISVAISKHTAHAYVLLEKQFQLQMTKLIILQAYFNVLALHLH